MASYTVHCPQHLNITMVEGFKEALQVALDQGGECLLHIGLVEKTDSTGLQLVVAFFESMRASGAQVSLKGESESFSETARILGVSQHLGID